MLRLEYIVCIDEASKSIVHVQCHVSNVNQDELLFRLGKWKYDIQLPERYITYMDAFVTDS